MIDKESGLSEHVTKGSRDDEKGERLSGNVPLLINLLKTIIGAGIISLPCAFKSFGYIPGMSLLAFAFVISLLGLYYYVLMKDRMGKDASSVNAAMLTYPSSWVLMDISVFMGSAGAVLAYMMLISDIVSSFVEGILGDGSSILTSGRVWLSVFMFLIVPLSYVKNLDSLKYSSLAGLLAVVYLAVISVVDFLAKGPAEGVVAVASISFGDLGRFGVFLLAYSCHLCAFPIFNSAEKDSVGNLSMISFLGMFISTVAFMVYGLFTYITYADVIGTRSIFSYYPAEVPFQIAGFVFSLLLAFSVPLMMVSLRSSSGSLFRFAFKGVDKDTSRVTITTVALAVLYGVALCQPDITAVLGLVGSASSPIYCFILPGMYYYKLTENEGWDIRRVLAVMLAAVGVVIFCACTAASLCLFF